MGHRRSSHATAFVVAVLAAGAAAADINTNSLRAAKPALVVPPVQPDVEICWRDPTPTAACIYRTTDLMMTPVPAPPAAPPIPPWGIIGSVAQPNLCYTDPAFAAPLVFYQAHEPPSGACSTDACVPAGLLGCGDSFTGRRNDDAGSTDQVDSYPGCSVFDADGPEFAYTFTANQDLTITATLRNLTADLDLFLLEGACDPALCTGHGDTSITFAVTAGTTYHLVVDGRTGAIGDYDLDFTCSGGTICVPADSIDCSMSDVNRNDAPGSAWELDDYAPCAVSDLTGPEYAYAFAPAAGAAVTAELLNLTADLDIVVLEDQGSGCDSTTCVDFGDSSVSFTASGNTYHLLVDGRNGAVGDYELRVRCGGTACEPPNEARSGCPVLASGNNGAPGSTVMLEDYGPCGVNDLTGPEWIYQWTAPNVDTDVVAILSNLTDDLDLAVIEDPAGSGCDLGSCLQVGDTEVQFAATAGATYYFVVDGRNGAISDFDIDVDCAPIMPGTCEPLANPLDCIIRAEGRTDDPGSTTGNNNNYACAGAGDSFGPEVTHSFTAGAAGDYTFRLTGVTGDNLDLYVLRDSGNGCDPSECIAFDDRTVTLTGVAAGERFFVVVDGAAAAAYSLVTTCPPQPCLTTQLECGIRNALAGDLDGPAAGDNRGSYNCSGNNMAGPEVLYQFVSPDPAEDWIVTARLEDFAPRDLDVFVLRNDGMGCETQDCLDWGEFEVTFTADAADQYLFAVDGKNGDAGTFRILLDCVEEPAPCVPQPPPLMCGQLLTGQSNDQAGSTDVIDAYPSCDPGRFDETGSEYAYTFTSAVTQDVTIDLENVTGGSPHLFVLEETGGGCQEPDCITFGRSFTVTFTAAAGRSYYILTDGFFDTVATFDLRVTCN